MAARSAVARTVIRQPATPRVRSSIATSGSATHATAGASARAGLHRQEAVGEGLRDGGVVPAGGLPGAGAAGGRAGGGRRGRR